MTAMLDVTVNGLAVGCAYALVALGFVVMYKATGVINFAQGGLMLVGAYLTWTARVVWGLPFGFALLVGLAGGALGAWLIQALVLRFMLGRPVFAQIMVTIGILFVLQQLVVAIWGSESLDLAAPWGNRTVDVAGAIVPEYRLWTIGFAALALGAFGAFFRWTPLGLAMRATAQDQEAALAVGISPARVFGVSWAVSGAVAALAAVLLTVNPGGLDASLQNQALLALPAIVLGGMDSPLGAVVSGILLGVAQGLAARYLPWGTGFPAVVPYVLMVLVLVVRPHGLFGRAAVGRV